MSDDLVKRARKALGGVTEGPWRVHDCESMGHRCTNYYQEVWNNETDILVTTEVTRAHNDGGAANIRFIAASRDLIPAMADRIEELEVKLAKAVEMLNRYGGVMPVAFAPIQDGGYKARTTLAELTGGKDE